MAYTSVIPVRRLDRAVKYVMNKEKTTAVSLQDALDYAANRDKTEQSCFESSYACTLETAFADMRQTKEQWHKSGGVQGYHLVQSFAAGEVTPELAHQIAKELADRVLGGQYEYVIGTHLNTGHIHSHIVWNSVSCVDGKKYRSNYKSYVTEIRAVSDELCRKYKLSVIDTENSNHVAKPYAEWLAEKNGQPTWRTAIRQDVDEAIQQSLTWRQFLSAMECKGYEVHMGRKYPVLRPPGKERFVRFKTLGKNYTPEVIQNRLLYPQFNRCFVENLPRVQYGRLHGSKPRRKLTGLRSDTARLMLANSEFLVMLNQSATDREELAKLLNISDNQLGYVTNVPAGCGLIRCAGNIVPFTNSFPKNTKLYGLMTTKPDEVRKE